MSSMIILSAKEARKRPRAARNPPSKAGILYPHWSTIITLTKGPEIINEFKHVKRVSHLVIGII